MHDYPSKEDNSTTLSQILIILYQINDIQRHWDVSWGIRESAKWNLVNQNGTAQEHEITTNVTNVHTLRLLSTTHRLSLMIMWMTYYEACCDKSGKLASSCWSVRISIANSHSSCINNTMAQKHFIIKTVPSTKIYLRWHHIHKLIIWCQKTGETLRKSLVPL